MPARSAKPKATREVAAGAPQGRNAAQTKRLKRNSKEDTLAEAKALSKAALLRVKKAIAAHALMRELGSQLELQAKLHPMQAAPKGLVKCAPVQIHMSRDLFEASRVARGPHKAAWKRVIRSHAEGVRKRKTLKRAMAAHSKDLQDEGKLQASPLSHTRVRAADTHIPASCVHACAVPTDNGEEFEQLPEARKAAYLAAAAAEDADDDDGVNVVEMSHKCVCTTPSVSHSLLALAPEGLRIGTCVTMHGREQVFASISKLQLVYDLKAESLSASIELNFQQQLKA